MATVEARFVELLGQASTEVDGAKKLEHLCQIKELFLNHGLSENFFDDILAFQSDRAPGVKKFILAFIEAACKHDFKFCPRSIFSLNLLLHDANSEVIKRSIQAASHFYKAFALWIVKTQKTPTPPPLQQSAQQQQAPQQPLPQPQQPTTNTDIEKTWLTWLQIQSLICNLLESTSNDGIRTHCIKFIETIVLMNTSIDHYTDAGFQLNLIDPVMTPVKLSDEAAKCGLAGLPKSAILFDAEHKLELSEAAKSLYEQLVAFHGTAHITSVNLMATMQSLVVLARQRSRLFMGRTTQAMESLNTRLPPTLTESQVQSVKKFLKLQHAILNKNNKNSNSSSSSGGGGVGNNNNIKEVQKRIKLEPGLHHHLSAAPPHPADQKPFGVAPGGAQGSQVGLPPGPGKAKSLDLNKLTQELDEKEKRQIVVDSVKRILGDDKCVHIAPAQMEVKKRVLSTLANEFSDTEIPAIIQDYVFRDIANRHEIGFAVIRKNYEVAARKAAKRGIDLLENQDLLKKYFDTYNSYLSRAMELKDMAERNILLPKLYALREEYYKITNQDQDEQQELEQQQQQQHHQQQEIEQQQQQMQTEISQ